MKTKPINIDQILSRQIKGYAFMKYPNNSGANSASEYREQHKKIIEADHKTMTVAAFRAKYESYIY